MKISIANSQEQFDITAARRIVDQICHRPDSVIGLSTGRTTGNIHRKVCEIHSELNFDVSRVTFFGLDEVTGVDREYSGACYKMLLTEIIEGLGVEMKNFIMLPTRSNRGGIDLLILGLGENGHLGFNQPGSQFNGGACTSTMDSRLEERIRRETATPDNVPLGGVTLGIRDIMHARRIILVANGDNKADIVKEMLCGPITTDVPASILQLHPDCEFIFDSKAASKIDVNKLRKS